MVWKSCELVVGDIEVLERLHLSEIQWKCCKPVIDGLQRDEGRNLVQSCVFEILNAVTRDV